MGSDEEKEEKRGFKVEDRRRFSESGESRSEQVDAPPPPQPAPAAERPPTTTSAEQHPHEHRQLELNLSTFILSLSTQALAHLGEIPNPIDNQTVVDLGAAKQLIDILGILKDKTKGNLDETETGLLESALYDLRLKYVERARGRS